MLFPTQEVGSLKRAPFIGKDPARASQLAEYWGEKLGVPGFRDFADSLRLGSATHSDTIDWACIYGLRFFESAGIGLIYDGEQRRTEMYEYPVSFIQGFEFRGVVKVWDNEFYRKAAVTSKPRLRSEYHLGEFLFNKQHTQLPLKVPVTGPYTLADWSFDEFYARRDLGPDPLHARREAKREFVLDLASEVVRPNLRSLVESGAQFIQLDEPAAAAKSDETDIFVESFNEATRGLNAEFQAHICYTNYANLFPALLDLRASVVSISCSNTDTKLLGLSAEARRGFSVLSVFRENNIDFKVAPGVVDVHTDYIEAPELVRDRLLYSAKLLGDPSKVVACNDCGLRTRSWEVAYQKQLSLSLGAALARQTYG